MMVAYAKKYWVCALFLTCGLLGLFFQNVSAATIAATITTGVFVPGEPVNLAVTIGDSSVSLSWSSPLSNGGTAVLDYSIEYRLASGGVWAVFNDGTSTNAFATVTGLSNDNAYEFRVSAVNAIGQGAHSSSVSAVPGAPAQVIISGFSDLSVPSIVTSVRITNEGSTPYEYQYTWCITDADTNLCGGGNDLFSATAAKLIQPGENFDTNLNSTLSVAGGYWFHVQVAFGSDTSYAQQSFVAKKATQSGGGGGGSKSSKRTPQCIGADLNHDAKISIIDFSILMVFFSKPSPFSNPCADINSDGMVNMIDFSVLLTQWGNKPTAFK